MNHVLVGFSDNLMSGWARIAALCSCGQRLGDYHTTAEARKAWASHVYEIETAE